MMRRFLLATATAGFAASAWANTADALYLTPAESLAAIQPAPGYAVELVAAEPLVQDPVAVAFDAKGRMWVVEMTTYMPNVDGTGEEVPEGHIVLVTDADGDGMLDTRNVVVDDIVLPRTVLPVAGGVLYADHTSLYYVELDGLTARSVELVDPTYVTRAGQNVEHRPNSLTYGLDNWIHSAKSQRTYRLLPLEAPLPRGASEMYRNARFKVALREGVERGQWGLDTDDFGRLYYTSNSAMLMGDRVDPFYFGWFTSGLEAAKWTASARDSRVYPIRPTPGVNRAAGGAMLDEDGKLISATSASGHAIYKSAHFPPEMHGASVVCEAVAFLCSARRIRWDGDELVGERIYGETELIASTEERFRPVNVHNAPDGSLYVVDMHRGLVQHVTYLTEYLKQYTLSQGLETTYSTGRIYRLLNAAAELDRVPDLSAADPARLVAALQSANSWQRTTARRLLIERGKLPAAQVDLIRDLARYARNPVTQVAALSTLEGLGVIREQDLLAAITADNTDIAAFGLRLAADSTDTVRRAVVAQLKQTNLRLPNRGDAATYYALLLATEGGSDTAWRLENIWQLAKGSEMLGPTLLAAYFDDLTPLQTDAPALHAHLASMREKQLAAAAAAASTDLPKGVSKGTMASGKRLYEGKAACAGCHGMDGAGVEGLAPKLAGSEWVTGNPDQLIALVLRGMHGPVMVDGELFDTPAIMPALMDNPNISDGERQNLITYVRNAWGNRGGPISLKQVQRVRMATADAPGPYTARQLAQMYPDK